LTSLYSPGRQTAVPSTWIIVAKGGDVLVPSVMLIGSFALEVAAHIWRVIEVADHD
jgi:hypothetical protein